MSAASLLVNRSPNDSVLSYQPGSPPTSPRMRPNRSPTTGTLVTNESMGSVQASTISWLNNSVSESKSVKKPFGPAGFVAQSTGMMTYGASSTPPASRPQASGGTRIGANR